MISIEIECAEPPSLWSASGQSWSVLAPSAVTAFGVIDGFNATAVNGWIWPIFAGWED